MLRLPAKPYRFGGCPCADCCNGREPRTTATMYGDDAMSGTYVMDLHSRHIEQHSVPELGLGARSAGWTPVWVDVPAISAVDVLGAWRRRWIDVPFTAGASKARTFECFNHAKGSTGDTTDMLPRCMFATKDVRPVCVWRT